MKELSLHILDVAENGIAAGADFITLLVEESRRGNTIVITITDNGKGLPVDMLEKVVDPFYTTRTTRRVGMGLSLLKAAAERCGGYFSFSSVEGQGCHVESSFLYDHIDRAPLGDMAMTLTVLVAGYPEVDFLYRHVSEGREFVFDLREIRHELDGIPLNEPAVIRHLKAGIKEGLEKIKQ